MAGADIIVTVTSSAGPVLERGWISDGAHINAVGAYHPAARELDGATVAAAALFADSRESLEAESGDFLLAVAEGLVEAGHLRGELGEVLTGAAPGRAGPDEITLFESLGLAVEDLAVAQHVCRQAVAAGAGTASGSPSDLSTRTRAGAAAAGLSGDGGQANPDPFSGGRGTRSGRPQPLSGLGQLRTGVVKSRHG